MIEMVKVMPDFKGCIAGIFLIIDYGASINIAVQYVSLYDVCQN
jgi:hypothetical protein